MGSEQPSVNKPSALPRPSRLPVLRNRSSQLSLSKQEDAVEPPKASNAPTRIQKRPSIPSFSRPGQPASKSSISTAKPLSTKSSLANGANHSSRASTSTTSSRTSFIRPSSGGNQQRLPSGAAKTSSPEEEENNDQLSSLDSFRAASRQGLEDDLPTEPPEYVEQVELPDIQNERKSSRPSLSDRTIESLQNVPSTPKDRRRSSFFSPIESPMGPPPRPNSSLSQNGSNGGSRPGTSDGNFAKPSSVTKRAPVSARPAQRSTVGGFGFTPGNANRRSVSTTFNSRLQLNKDTAPSIPRSPSPSKQSAPTALANGISVPKHTPISKTVSAKSSKPRPPLSAAFGPAVREVATENGQPAAQEASAPTPTTKSTKRAVSSPSTGSSAALRQQIAAAKAAARKEKAKHDSPLDNSIANGDSFGMEIHGGDPFNQAPKDEKHILRNRINNARLDGKLNITAMGLKEIPEEVLKMYDAAAMEESKVNWAEVVDLTRFIAADNEIEELGELVFPDKSVEEFDADDQSEGNQFGGLEMLDLHGNKLQSIPMGLRRLERLTSLNLAHNKLENSAIDVISQITSLKDLKLGHNTLSGSLPTALCNLHRLETLDLQANRLLGLPEALREFVSLRVLNISGNQLTALPMEALQELPLVELDASSNSLIASLFPLGVANTHPTLQVLKVANNSLAALTFDETVELPQLRTLDVTNNHLTSLPPVHIWTELITLTAGDNKIAELPSGFTALRKLRNANFTSNELRLLEPEIAKMESLESLILASNPLRDKKFLTMSAADIRRDLKARLEPTETESVDSAEHDMYHDARDAFSPTLSSPSASWLLKPNGALDLAGRGYSDDINDSLGSFLKSNEVKQLHLEANLFTGIPPALWLGQDLRLLDLSGNALGSVYLSDELSLPALQELNISRCGINNLEPLVTQLQAPRLQTLNVSANKLSGTLPALRRSYPALTTLLASDNKFSAISADSLRGFHIVNLASNNIEQLPAELGLLWDEGLRSLEVGSNAFRVPNYRILEKGTEATLRWLKDRLPVAHGAVVGGADDVGGGGELD